MRADVQHSWSWANTFLPAIKDALASVPFGTIGMLEVASEQEDLEYATDYLLKLGIVSVGCRIRSAYYMRFGDFTIRSRRDSGAATELDKWKAGIYPDRYFYGWGDAGTLAAWLFIDIHSLVERGLHLASRAQIPNGDGTYFIGISQQELNGCILASTWPQESL